MHLSRGRKEEHQHGILQSCTLHLVPGRLRKAKDRATHHALPPWASFQLEECLCSSAMGWKPSGCAFPEQEKPPQHKAAGRWLWTLCEMFISRNPFIPWAIPVVWPAIATSLGAGNVLSSSWCLALRMLLQLPTSATGTLPASACPCWDSHPAPCPSVSFKRLLALF